MKTIQKLWFENERLYMLCSNDVVYSKPLEMFPTLKEASDAARNKYTITMRGEAVRWAEIDEDIHISSFFDLTEPTTDNEIAQLFKAFPQLNVSEVARAMGIHKSLLAKYIYGIKRPSPERVEFIKNRLRELGQRLMAV